MFISSSVRITLQSNRVEEAARQEAGFRTMVRQFSVNKHISKNKFTCFNNLLSFEDTIDQYLIKKAPFIVENLQKGKHALVAADLCRYVLSSGFVEREFGAAANDARESHDAISVPEAYKDVIPRERYDAGSSVDAITFLTTYWGTAIAAGVTQQIVNIVNPALLPAVHAQVKELKAAKLPIPKFKWPRIERGQKAFADMAEAQAYLEKQRLKTKERVTRWRDKHKP